MSERLKPGEIKIFEKEVLSGDLAAFNNELVHEVYSTFALARDMEWSSRLILLEILEEDEEGIGTELQIKHFKPAFLGQKLSFEASVKKYKNKILDCEITVKCGKKIVATGFTQQKILNKKLLSKIFTSHKNC